MVTTYEESKTTSETPRGLKVPGVAPRITAALLSGQSHRHRRATHGSRIDTTLPDRGGNYGSCATEWKPPSLGDLTRGATLGAYTIEKFNKVQENYRRLTEHRAAPPRKLNVSVIASPLSRLSMDRDPRDTTLVKLKPEFTYFGCGLFVEHRPTHAHGGFRFGEASNPGPNPRHRAPKATGKQEHRNRERIVGSSYPKRDNKRAVKACGHVFCKHDECYINGHYHQKKRDPATGHKLRQIQKLQEKNRAGGIQVPRAEPEYFVCPRGFGFLCQEDHFHDRAQLKCGPCTDHALLNRSAMNIAVEACAEEEKSSDVDIYDHVSEIGEVPWAPMPWVCEDSDHFFEEAIVMNPIFECVDEPESSGVVVDETSRDLDSDDSESSISDLNVVSELTLSDPVLETEKALVPQFTTISPELKLQRAPSRSEAARTFELWNELAYKAEIPVPPDTIDLKNVGIEVVYVFSRLPGDRDPFSTSLLNRFLALFLETDLELRRNGPSKDRYGEIVECKGLFRRHFRIDWYFKCLRQVEPTFRAPLSKRVYTDIVLEFGFNSCTLEPIFTPLYDFLWQHSELRCPQYIDDAFNIRNFYSGKVRIVAQTFKGYDTLNVVLCDTTISYVFFQFCVRDYLAVMRKGKITTSVAPGKEQPSLRKLILNRGDPKE